jgi:hypothetical protein
MSDMTRCKDFANWIADAAPGDLAPQRERELLAHTGECDSCRRAYRRARELVALVDRGIESLVATEPSPQFAARLRARIAEEQPAKRSASLTWKPLAAGLVAAAAAAASWVFLAPGHTNSPPKSMRPGSTVASATLPETHTPEEPTTNQDRIRRAYQPPAQVVRGTAPSREQLASRFGSHGERAVGSSWASRHANSPAEPEVLVPPGQFEAVMQLAADICSGRIDAKQLIAQQKQMKQPLKINSLDIPPLVKPQPYLYPASDTLPDTSEP